MAATVKRNNKGEITHILVGADMMAKEDANKVLYGNVDPAQVESFLVKLNQETNPNSQLKLSVLDAIELIADILNEKESIFEYKKRILGYKK